MSNDSEILSSVRRAFADRLKDERSDKSSWRLAAFVALFLLVVSVVANTYLAFKSDIRPYAVELNDSKVTRIREIDMLVPNQTRIESDLQSWIFSCRAVVGNADLQGKMIDKCFSFVKRGSAGFDALARWFGDNNPHEASATGLRVFVVPDPISAVNKSVFEISWTEQSREQPGEEPVITRYKGFVTIGFEKITNEEELMLNPYGLTIDELDWSSNK